MAFQTVFLCVCVMLVYMAIGYGAAKGKKVEVSHAKSLSGLLLYVFSPCLMINAFLEMEYSLTLLKKTMVFCAVMLLVQILFLLVLFLLLHKKYDNPKMRILTLGGFVGNVGFFGLPVINGLFPNVPIASCYSIMYVLAMNFLVFTVGMYLITNDTKYVSFRGAICNPTTFSVAVGLLLYLMKVNLPPTFQNMIALLGKMCTPVCMIVLGMRLASMDFKSIFVQPFAYVVCALKLIVYPLFVFLLLWFLPWFDHTFKVCAYVLSAAPSAAVVLTVAELHNCEQKLCANVVLLTTICSLLTMPLMTVLL